MKSPTRLLLSAVAISLAWLASAPAIAADEPQTDPAHVEFFEKKVRPLLATRCHECHGAKTQKGSLRLDSRAAVLAGGDTGEAIVPGKPDESLLVDAIRYGDIYQMPPKSQLPDEEIATLVEWVRLGAPWGHETAAPEQGPEQGPSSAPPSSTWQPAPNTGAFSRFRTPPPPATKGAWATTPIDRFILARLEAAGLQPAPAADKRTLIRRRDLRPDRLAAHAGGDRRFSGRPAERRLRAAGRSPAGFAALRRALGTPLARPGALCRNLRPRVRLRNSQRLSLSRLRHSRIQRRRAVRSVRARARRRRLAAQPAPPSRRRQQSNRSSPPAASCLARASTRRSTCGRTKPTGWTTRSTSSPRRFWA